MKTIKSIALLFAAMAFIATGFSSCTPDDGGKTEMADLTELNAAIAECEAALTDAEGQYPADAIATLQGLVNTAKAAAAKNLSQTAADNLAQQLTAALATFEATKLEAIPANALAFALSFDEGQGTSLTTTGAYQWTAALMPSWDNTGAAPVFVDGKKGKALQFADGGHIEISNYAKNVLLSKEFSISAWLKVNEANDANFVVSYNSYNTWKFNVPTHGKPFFTVATVNGIVDMDNETEQSVPVGTWAHVTISCNTTVGEVSFYVNGAHTKTWTTEAKGGGLQGDIKEPTVEELALCIGAEHPNASISGFDWVTPESPYGSYFRGIIDEFQFYNVALTAGQAAALYNTYAE